MSAIEFKLVLITNRHLVAPNPLLLAVQSALDSGIKAVQLREKDLSTRALFELAEDANALCQAHKAHLFVNDRIDVAAALPGCGVHLTAKSLSAAIARQQLQEKRKIGVSTHSVAEARTAAQDGCDFLLFGPIFETPSKPGYGRPQGVQKLAQVAEAVEVPVFAVGGITPERARRCLAHGASGIAVISAIMASEDIPKTVAAFETALAGL
ncbi:MAG: thiamine phosphate synthase [bacterium]